MLELVVMVLLVMLLLGIAAGRLSRTQDAALHAQLRTLAGSLQTAVSAFQANWHLQDEPAVNVAGWADGTVDANADGYPTGSRRDAAAVGQDEDCEDIWHALLQNPPAIVAVEPDLTMNARLSRKQRREAGDSEWAAGQADWIDDATVTLPESGHAEICQFISLHYQAAEAGTPRPTIFYDSRSGRVFTDLERVF